MITATFSNHGALQGVEEFALVGVYDLQLVQGASGPTLYTATRGDGWLTSFDVGIAPGATTFNEHWRISPDFLQLETTDLVLRGGADGTELYMAGLNDSALNGVRLGADGITGTASVTSSGWDMGLFTEVEMFGDTDSGIATLRSGGLVSISFGSAGLLDVSAIRHNTDLGDINATDIATASHNGETYAFVSFQSHDVLAMFRQQSDGTLTHITDIDASYGFWSDRPSDMAVTTAADGRLYVVAASSGSDSLTTFSVSANGMTPVDHLIDGLDTRFADASHVTSVAIGDHSFVLAAGSDSGISVFTMLPGGRLQHIISMAGTAKTPLNGITAIEAIATPDGIRMWVSTEAAPFLAEFSLDLPDLGLNLSGNASDTALNGTASDDILSGAGGNDQISGGEGNDILLDGAGTDHLQGGAGADTFILTQDGARDIISDFQSGIDRIDLSDFGVLGGLGGLAISTQSWGAEVWIDAEVLEIRSANGASLSGDDLEGALVTTNRIQSDPGQYPGAPSASRPDPNTGKTANPDTTNPADLAPQWIDAPEFTATANASDSRGTAGADMMHTYGQNDRLFGGTGNDTIIAGFGADTVSGDGGNDSIHGDGNSDLLLGGAGFDTIIGGRGNDAISGDSFADLLRGGDGNDIILGGDGFDNIYGENGADSIWAGAAPDRVFGGAGDDWLSGGSNFGTSVDGIFGEGGNDTLFGNAGFDLLNGGAGDDVLDGGHQADNLYGEDGNDILIGGLGFDRLFGGEGQDKLYGGASGDGLFGQGGDDTLWGGEGSDRFFGGQGNDILDGGSGNDTIYADAGFDTIIGGIGNDLMFGSFNADEFVFENGHGDDTVADFDAFNDNEVLDLSDLDGFDDMQDVQDAAAQSGRDVLINTGDNSSIRLRDVDLDDLDENDFTF